MSDARLKQAVELGAAIKAAETQVRDHTEQLKQAQRRLKELKAHLQNVLDGGEIPDAALGPVNGAITPISRSQMSTKDLVLQFLKSRPGESVTSEEVISEVGGKADTIRTTLNRLAKSNSIENPSRGIYRLSRQTGGQI